VVVMFDARLAPPAEGPAPVLVSFGPPDRQRRLTVAARLVLAVPHILALGLLAVVALVVAVVGWCGALVDGRLPRPAAEFLSGYLRWQARLGAYLFLLTDVYPPFTLHDSGYPVRVATQPGPLNRWAVAFRLVLAVPALVVMATATYGIATVVLVVSWFVVLATGRVPPSLHQVFAAFLRYQARVDGYLFMVTSQYPWGLLGDPETSPAGAPGDGAAAPVPWRPSPPSPVHDPYWQVVLTARAKNLLVFVIVLGVASLAVLNIANAVSRYNRFQTEQAAGARVQSAYQTLSTRVVGYASATRSCESSVEPLPCLTGAALSVSEAFTVFGRRLTATAMPASAATARSVVVADSARAERDFAALSVADSTGRYQLAIESSKLTQLLTRFDRDYQELGTHLDNLG
jgi:hypothetical protein